MKRYIKYIIPFFSFVVVAICIIIIKGDRVVNIDDMKSLKVVTNSDYSTYYVGDSLPYGWQYNIIMAMADSLSLPLEIDIEKDPQKSIKGIRRGKYNIMMTTLPNYLFDKDKVSISLPIYKSHLVLLQMNKSLQDKDLYISTLTDLEGKKVYIPSGYSISLEQLIKESEISFEYQYYEGDIFALSQAVASKEIKYAIVDVHTAESITHNYPTLDYHLKLSINYNISLISQKGSDLSAFLERFINQLTNYPSIKKSCVR